MQERFRLLRQGEVENHYSDKGGHRARHDHWNGMRRMYSSVNIVPRELAWIIRRSMRRDPQSGK